jgi:hypothetical protein
LYHPFIVLFVQLFTAGQMATDGDRFARWSETTRTQLGYSTNLILGLSVGLLAFFAGLVAEQNLILDETGRSIALLAIVSQLLSVLLGIAVTVSRLIDFRMTSRIVRKRDRDGASNEQLVHLRTIADRYGKATWRLFWCQLVMFCAGSVFFTTGFIYIFRAKLL